MRGLCLERFDVSRKIPYYRGVRTFSLKVLAKGFLSAGG